MIWDFDCFNISSVIIFKSDLKQCFKKNKKSLADYTRDWGREENKIKRYPKLFKLMYI